MPSQRVGQSWKPAAPRRTLANRRSSSSKKILSLMRELARISIREGKAQLDAILMDGRSLQSGAIGAVERIRNPIRLARLVLEKGEHSFLVGAGAEQFAVETGIRLCDPSELITPYEQERWAAKAAESGAAVPSELSPSTRPAIFVRARAPGEPSSNIRDESEIRLSSAAVATPTTSLRPSPAQGTENRS